MLKLVLPNFSFIELVHGTLGRAIPSSTRKYRGHRSREEAEKYHMATPVEAAGEHYNPSIPTVGEALRRPKNSIPALVGERIASRSTGSL